jgi:methyltransferase (TIGR00027 family)
VEISAPARLLAAHRARETERPDAIFRDPWARPLLGAADPRLARVLSGGDASEWLFTARTYIFDRLITREVAAGADLVINLAAGLDARPYRLTLPPSLRWVDVDLPEILDYKAAVLSAATPSCEVSFRAVDLANPDARRGLFRDLARAAQRVLIVSESLLIHLMTADVRLLAADLAAPASVQRWITDLVSPPLMETLIEQNGDIVRAAGAPYVFAPREGPRFLDYAGWRLIGARSLLQAAMKLERLPFALRMVGLLSEGELAPHRAWAGACLFGKDPEN